MAESYRGLTIRIGGDTTKLTKALKAANGAASQTQAELKKVGQALRLDPTNVEAFNTQLGLMSDQATNVAMKMSTLAEARRQLASSDIKIKTLEDGSIIETTRNVTELIDEIRRLNNLSPSDPINAGLNLGVAKTALESVTASLANAHNEVTELANRAKRVESSNLELAFSFASNKDLLKDEESAIKEILENLDFSDNVKRSEEQLEELAQSVLSMAKRLSGAFDINTGVFDPEKLKRALRKISKEDMSLSISINTEGVESIVERLTQKVEKGGEAIQRSAERLEAASTAYDEAKETTAEAMKRSAEEIERNAERVANAEKEITRIKGLDEIVEAQKKYNDAITVYRSNIREMLIELGGFEGVKKLTQSILDATESQAEELAKQASATNDEWVAVDNSVRSVNERLERHQQVLTKSRSARRKQTDYERSVLNELNEAREKTIDLDVRIQNAMSYASNSFIQGLESKASDTREAVLDLFRFNDDAFFEGFNIHGLSADVDAFADSFGHLRDEIGKVIQERLGIFSELKSIREELDGLEDGERRATLERNKSELQELMKPLDAQYNELRLNEQKELARESNLLAETAVANYERLSKAETTAMYAGISTTEKAKEANESYIESLEALRRRYTHARNSISEQARLWAGQLRNDGNEESAALLDQAASSFASEMDSAIAQVDDRIVEAQTRLTGVLTITEEIEKANERSSTAVDEIRTPTELYRATEAYVKKLEKDYETATKRVGAKVAQLAEAQGAKEPASIVENLQKEVNELKLAEESTKESLDSARSVLAKMSEGFGDKTMKDALEESLSVPTTDMSVLLERRSSSQKKVNALTEESTRLIDERTKAEKRRDEAAKKSNATDNERKKLQKLLSQGFEDIELSEEELERAAQKLQEIEQRQLQLQGNLTKAQNEEAEAVERLAKAKEELTVASSKYNRIENETDMAAVDARAERASAGALREMEENLIDNAYFKYNESDYLDEYRFSINDYKSWASKVDEITNEHLTGSIEEYTQELKELDELISQVPSLASRGVDKKAIKEEKKYLEERRAQVEDYITQELATIAGTRFDSTRLKARGALAEAGLGRQLAEQIAAGLDLSGVDYRFELDDNNSLDAMIEHNLKLVREWRAEVNDAYNDYNKHARKLEDYQLGGDASISRISRNTYKEEKQSIDKDLRLLEKRLLAEQEAYARIREVAASKWFDPESGDRRGYKSDNIAGLYREINELQDENNKKIKDATKLRQELESQLEVERKTQERIKEASEESRRSHEAEVKAARQRRDAIEKERKELSKKYNEGVQSGIVGQVERNEDNKLVPTEEAKKYLDIQKQIDAKRKERKAAQNEIAKAEGEAAKAAERFTEKLTEQDKVVEGLEKDVQRTSGYLERLSEQKDKLSSDKATVYQRSGTLLKEVTGSVLESTQDDYLAAKKAADESRAKDLKELNAAYDETIEKTEAVTQATNNLARAQTAVANAKAEVDKANREEIESLTELNASENRRLRNEATERRKLSDQTVALTAAETELKNEKIEQQKINEGSTDAQKALTKARNDEAKALANLNDAQEAHRNTIRKTMQKVLDTAYVKASELTSEQFNDANKNTDVSYIRQVLLSIKAAAGLSSEEIGALTGDLDRLTKGFEVAGNEVAKWKIIARLESLNNELIKGEAQAVNFAKALSNMDAPSKILRGDSTDYSYVVTSELRELIDSMPRLQANIKVLSDAYSELMSMGDTFAKSFEIDPTNLDLLESSMNSYSAAELVALEHMRRLKSEMEAYEGSGISRWTNDTISLKQALFDASTAAEKAQKNLDRIEGRIGFLENENAKLENERESSVTTDRKDEFEQNEERLKGNKEALEELNEEREEAIRINQKTQETLEQLRRINEYEGKVAEAEQLRQKIDAANKKLIEFNQNLAVRTQFGDLKEIDNLSSDLKAATARAKALKELSELFPDDIRLTASATEALADKERLAEMLMERLGEEIENIDTSQVDLLRDYYGSIGAAVRGTAEEAAHFATELSEAKVKLSDFIRDNGLEAFRSDIENLSKPLDDTFFDKLKESFGPSQLNLIRDGLLSIRDVISSLSGRFDDSVELAQTAAILQQRDKLISVLGETMKETRIQAKVDLDLDTSIADEVKKLQDKLKNLGSSIAQSMPETTFDLSSVDKVISDALSKAKSLGQTFSSDVDNVYAYTMAASALESALNASALDADRLQEALASYDSAKLYEKVNMDQLAIDTLRAEEAVRKANEALSETKSELEELDKKRKKTTDPADLSDLDQQIDEAKKKYADLADQAKKATEALDLQKSAQEMESYTQRLIQLNEGVREIASQMLTLSNTASIASVFGDTSELTAMKTEFDNAVKKAKELKEQLEADKGNSKLEESLKAQLEEVERLRVAYAGLVKTATSSFDRDAELERLVAKYGSLGEAVVKTSSEYKRLAVDIANTRNVLVSLLKEAGIDGSGVGLSELRVLVNKNADAFSDDLKNAIMGVLAALDELIDKQDEYAEDSGIANVIRQFDQLKGAVRSANTETAKLNKPLKQERGDSQAAFISAVREIGQEARQAGQKIATSAQTIDAAYRDMRKTVEGTEEQFESLRNEAIRFSQTHAVSADQILEMESLGGQLGIAAQDLQQFGELASNLVISTDIEAGDVALQLGQISNIMSDLSDMDSIERFGDALVRLGNNAAAQESAIMNVAQRIAAVANVTSMSSAQVLGWASAVAETGMRSESAATAIVNTIEGIGNAVAAGGATLEQFASIAGMSADEFKAKWANSSSEALQAFVEGLEVLTDDSTAAIEALDSVGISSVRQETALLALSQTVDNLSGNIAMAESAFRSGGDAAQEAQNKSEGISGSLAILQNNVDVLAATLGESLKPAVDAATVALRLLNGLLDAIGPAARTVIVTVGGLAAAIGTTVPIIDQFVKGWNEITADKSAGIFIALKDSITKFGTALKQTLSSIKGMGTGFAGAIASGQGLSAAFTAMGASAASAGAGVTALVASIAPLLILTAVFAAISTVVNELDKWRKHTEMVQTATVGLTEAVNAAGPAYEEYANGVKKASKSVQELREESKNALSSQAELAKELNDRWADVGTNAAIVDHYVSTIEELTKKQKLNKQEQVELAAAVAGYNEITGQSLKILDEEKGIIDNSTGALKLNADMWKKRAESEAAFEMYKDVVKQRIEDEIALADVRQKIAESEKKQIVTTGLLYNNYNATNEKVVDLQREEKELTAAIAACDETLESYQSHMLTHTETLAQVEKALSESGDSLTNYKFLTDENLSEIANMWDNDVSKVLDYIDTLKKATKDVGVSKVSRKPTDDEAEKYKNALEKTYTEEKRLRDDFYDNEKKKQDDAYENRKRLLDDEYDYVKSTLDKEYDARKQELDDEYDATKDILDKAHDLRKRELDKEYDMRKRELDKEYDARKKALDKEYDAAKSASDKWLKQYKKDQDAQVDAFKSATDARIEEIDREYDAKKKLLNAEYEGYDSDIDDRIKAIEAEQDAEDKALKQQERQEKLAELGKAVETAKGAKKREEAEKALQDYKDQLAREDVKEQRQAQIEILNNQKDALKQQLSDREEHLKETYDSVKEEYKNERDAQLEAIQEANEAEYELLKENEDAKLEVIKEANDAALEELKLSHDDELSELKQNHEDILTAIKDDNEAQLLVIKRGHEAELQSIKETNDEKLKVVKRNQEDELNDLKDQNENILKELKRGHEDELTEIKEFNDRKYKAYKEGGQAAVDALLAAEGMLDHAASKSKLLDYGSKITNAVSGWLDGIGLSTHGKLFGVTSDWMSEMSQGLRDNSRFPITEVNNLKSAILSAFKIDEESAKSTTAGLATGSAKGITENATVPAMAAGNAKSGLIGSFAVTEEEGKGLTVNMMHGAASGIKENSEAPTGAMGDVADKLLGVLYSVGEDVVPPVAQLMSELASAIFGNTDKPVQAAGEATNQIVSTFNPKEGQIEPVGASLMTLIANGISNNSDKPVTLAQKVAQSIAKQLDISKATESYGANAAISFNNAFLRNAQQVIQNAQQWASNIAKTVKSTLGINSPSRVFQYIVDMIFSGFNGQWSRDENSTLGIVKRTAQSIDGIFGSDIGSLDVSVMDEDMLTSQMERMQSIVNRGLDDMYDSMRDRLLKQADMMQEILSTGFDPTRTVDAAFEAINRINAGELRTKQLVASAQPIDNSTYAPVININIPEVVVREDADIDRLSQQIALRVQRSLNARIG